MANARLQAVRREEVVLASQRIEPKPIQKWSVVVSGQEYPVKQVLMEAANLVNSTTPRVTPADFIAHFAVRKLKQLGFTVNYYEKGI
jgi:hypothetical protein